MPKKRATNVALGVFVGGYYKRGIVEAKLGQELTRLGGDPGSMLGLGSRAVLAPTELGSMLRLLVSANYSVRTNRH